MMNGEICNDSLEYALSIIGGKWKLIIIQQINLFKPIRFGDLKSRINGISSASLTKSLQELETDRIIKRTQYSEIPPRVEYNLTEEGNKLIPIIESLGQWGISHKKVIVIRRDTFNNNANK